MKGSFSSWPFWISFYKIFFFCFISMKTSSPIIWGIIYFFNMDGFFRILEKTLSKLKMKEDLRFSTCLLYLSSILYNYFHRNCPYSLGNHCISLRIEYKCYHWGIWTVLKSIELKYDGKKALKLFFWLWNTYALSLPPQFRSSELSPQSL